MTDVRLENGEIVCDAAGRPLMLSPREAAFQRAFLCASVPLGSFIYNRRLGTAPLGSDSTEMARQRVQTLIGEALADYANTSAEVLALTENTVQLRVTVDGESQTREVLRNGDL